MIKVELKGNKAAINAIKKSEPKVIEYLEDQIQITCDDILAKADSRVKVDNGFLKGGMYREVKGLNGEVGNNRHYSPYVEFGTGGMVDVPKGLESYAIQFKGDGIKQVNLPARPFLFNSAFEETQEMIKRMKKDGFK